MAAAVSSSEDRMTDNEKLEELYAQFAKEKDLPNLTQITEEIARVFATKKQRIKQLQDDLCAIQNPSKPSEDMEHERPMFGGNASEAVPQVDPDDVKAVWKLFQETERANPGGNVG
jgi:hypothetical protein